MTAIVLQGDARQLPLPDECVDLLVTSPPYFGLRSYTDGGEHYAGQIGSEATPQAYLEALWACTAEWVRVLKPGGSMFINMGDKYGGGIWPSKHGKGATTLRDFGPKTGTDPDFAARALGAPKSLLGLPWRYAIGCTGTGTPYQRERYAAALLDDVMDDTITVDEARRRMAEWDAQPKSPGLGLILRAEVIWAKPNGLPESVTDRVRRAHEQVFHFTRQPRYYAAVDEIREGYAPGTAKRYAAGYNRTAYQTGQVRVGQGTDYSGTFDENPLGKLPGSVWSIPSAPLQVPARLGADHFAAFPPALVRPLVLGWSPPGVCTGCGEGRRPVVDKALEHVNWTTHPKTLRGMELHDGHKGRRGRAASNISRESATITGYACACPQPTAPTRPAVCLDPFGGTGTTALVATTHGRVGITVDRSADYCRLAAWRVNDPGERARARDMPKPPPIPEGMEPLFTM